MTPPTPPRAFVFAGGGSGGHIFPALAIGEELQRLSGGLAACVFVCSDRPLDAQILKRENAEYRIVPAKPISARPRGMLRFIRGWGPSVRAGRSLIRELAAEHGLVHTVAMGGFVAAPIARAARAERSPILLVNLDAVPGKANRLIARSATSIVSCVPIVGPCASLNWPVVPPIVRPSALSAQSREACRLALGLAPDVNTLLVTGGSQGAVSINRTVFSAAHGHPDAFKGWQIIHQTGRGEDAEAERVYRELGIRAVVRSFFERMGDAWRASDLAVSRAGAGGVAEAWAYCVPTLFMPNPYHKDQHQRHNATRLTSAGAAMIVDDRIKVAENAEHAARALSDILRHPEARSAMLTALASLGPADGASRIASALLGAKYTNQNPS